MLSIAIKCIYGYLSYPHLSVMSDCDHLPDVRLNLDHSPELLLIRPANREDDQQCRLHSISRLLPADQVAATPRLQSDNVTPQVPELVAQDPRPGQNIF